MASAAHIGGGFDAPRAAFADLGRRQFALIGSAAIAAAVFLSGFVISEPAPYELFMAGLIPLWALFGGLTISAGTAPLLVLLIVFNLGGLVSVTQMKDLGDGPMYVAVSTFLALSAVFYASVVEADWRRLRLIYNAYLLAALATGALGILGYFNAFPGAAQFTLYERAKGAFQDPNVFGPFLTLPAVYLVQRLVSERLVTAPWKVAALGVLTLAVFLSFSRAAWGLYGGSIVLCVGFLLLKERSAKFRLKIATIAIAGIVLMLLVILVALQSDKVSSLFSERAQLVQSYDSARLGRFARHLLGFEMAMEHPLGIGPLVFGPIYGEDTHNIWLKSLLDYSWLGFIAYVTFTILTLSLGLKILLRERPWQPYLMSAYSVFVCHVVVGNVIDTDHWRHFYLIAGILWGCIALERRWGRPMKKAVPVGTASPLD
ncbi:O-antigen ligase family protein [Aureimonas sp. Leaf454]|uniref:O-antigen ligase family protein n=1 Tax=Aureimonas sp. Leaf454 TaxID=1736381 RepID=UPI000A843AEE|nr:O-antigen ligase family protein [Aureimonas sp. Leaf454]